MQLIVPYNGRKDQLFLLGPINVLLSPPSLHLLVPRAVHDLLEHFVEHVLLGLGAAGVARLPHVHLVPEIRYRLHIWRRYRILDHHRLLTGCTRRRISVEIALASLHGQWLWKLQIFQAAKLVFKMCIHARSKINLQRSVLRRDRLCRYGTRHSGAVTHGVPKLGLG